MSYKFDSIVNRQEADALKEMIFRRAQERAQSYNDSEQTDVMDMARSSFVSKNNPFSQIVSGEDKVNEPAAQTSEPEKNESREGIGFPQRELKVRQNNTINEQISTLEIQSTMREARETLSNRSGFMGALNFLNTQAAVSLIRTRADKFEVLV